MLKASFLKTAIVAICLTAFFSLSHPKNVQSEPEYPPKPVPGSGEVLEVYPGQVALSEDIPQPQNSPQAGSFPQSFGDWETTAYQSYVSGGWEVLLRQGGDVNLSNSAAYDGNPDIDPVNSRVAFESERTGNSDIFVSPYNGVNLINLTDTRWDEIDPAWSPDGTKIAFANNRTGSFNIFTALGDGSNTQQLTSSTASNFSPTWSPDGKKIAWVQASGGVGVIWVMNANGSGQHPISSGIVFLNNLAWSPDGSQIAFDGDLDGDYWNEIGLIHPDGSGLKVGYDRGIAGYELLMGNWGTAGKIATFTEMQYIEYNGTLYILSASIGYLDPNTSSGYTLYLTSGDNMSPDNFSRDTLPPVSKINPLPKYLRAFGFLLTWFGQDQGISGINLYRIDTRKETEPDWFLDRYINAPTTKTTYSQDYCGKLFFRSAARDGADNWEAIHVGEGDAWTNLIRWQIMGGILDNRGVPVPNAHITLSPSPYEPSITDQMGKFITRVCTTNTYTINSIVTGFGNLLDTTMPVQRDKTYSLYLPPQNNVVLNGEFETSPVSTDWEKTGGFIEQTFAGHTGENSIRLSNDCSSGQCFSAVETPFSGNTYHASMAVDRDGNAHIVYNGNRYIVRSAQGVWSNPEIIGTMIPPPFSPSKPFIAVDSLKTLHVVMSDFEATLHYYIKPHNGSWTYVGQIPQASVSGIVVNQQDTVYFLYQTYSSSIPNGFHVARRVAAGGWEPSYKFFPNTYPGHSSGITLSKDNSVHLIIFMDNALYTHVVISPNGTVKTYPDVFKDHTQCPSIGGLQFVALPDNKIVVVWQGTNNYLCKYEGQVGQPWTQTKISTNRFVYYSIVADQTDTVHIFARDYSSGKLRHLMIVPGYDQTFESIIGDVTGDITPWVNETGTIQFSIGQYDALKYFKSIPAEQENTQLNQTITVSAEMVNPTLSFLYSTLGKDAGLDVVIQSGDETFIYPQPATTSWAQGWVDLTPWQGQSIEVRFQFTKAAGVWPFADYLLDSVTVGSWTTPVITAVSPPSIIEAWEAVTVTLTGDNFLPESEIKIGEIPITPVDYVDEHTLRITLPGGLPIGTQDVWITNPDGKKSVLVGGLRLGYFNNLPVILR